MKPDSLRYGLVIVLVFFSFSFKEETTIHAKKREDPALTNPYYTLGINFIKKGNPDHALVFFLKARMQFLQSKDNRGLIYCLYQIASIENNKNNFVSAHHYISSADSLIELTKKSDPLWADISYLKGNIYFKKNEFDKSYQVFEKCLLKFRTTKAPDSAIARIYARKATIEYYKGDYSSAIESFTKSGKFGETAFGKYSLFVSDQVNNQGVINLMMARNDEALANFQQSENIMKTGKISSSAAFAGTNTNIGLIFKIRNDFTNALQFFNRSLELYLSDPVSGNPQIANAYLNVAMVYQRLGNLTKQLEYLKKSLYYSEKYLPVLLPKIYWQLATYYSDLSDFKTAENYYAKSIKKNKELFGDGPALATILNNYGEFNMYYTKDFNKSLAYFNKALPFYRKLYGDHHPSTANCLKNIGEIYFCKKEYKKALQYYHQGIIALTETFSDPDVFSNPILEQSLSEERFIEILKSKAKVFQAISELQSVSSEKTRYLEASFKNYVLALKVIDKIRMGYENDESRIFLSENEQETYENSIHAGLSLYETTHQKKFLEEVFVITDQCHSSSLQSVIREKEWIKNLPKSDSMLVSEFRIKKDLDLYNEFILKEKISQRTDSAKLRIWNQIVSELTLKHENLKATIKAKNPVYYQFRYRTRNSELVNALKHMIDKKEAIVEYFYYSKTLITFCLTTDTLIYSSQVLPNEFERNIGKVLSFVREPKVYRSDSVYCLDYRSAGWELYQQLIKPFDGMLKGKHLIIVPDNKLMYIPFETLLTKETSSKPYNFKELPYLVKEHPVRYLYAASLLNIQRTEHSSGKMAAFVPEYPEEKEDNKNHLAASKTRGQLLDLQQTMNEAKAINSFFPGKVFSKKEASEENFKKNAPQFGTVLLAMHAVIDDENPLYSHLVFTSNSSKNEDDQLYIYETYNLNLNSELLVLSACNTGVGKLRKGEGMMSLTRGFSFAGVQSIVMTLWSVNDNSSADLMKRFYRKLSGLWEKDKALQEAKTEYIQNSDILHAHPYFWAGYVLIGDNKPLHDSRLSVWYWLVLIPLGFAIWFGMRYFRIKSSS